MKKAPYKLHLKKDDIVQVISGKEKGKKGKVLAIFPGELRAVSYTHLTLPTNREV